MIASITITIIRPALARAPGARRVGQAGGLPVQREVPLRPGTAESALYYIRL